MTKNNNRQKFIWLNDETEKCLYLSLIFLLETYFTFSFCIIFQVFTINAHVIHLNIHPYQLQLS